jgi:hypothetical protein
MRKSPFYQQLGFAIDCGAKVSLLCRSSSSRCIRWPKPLHSAIWPILYRIVAIPQIHRPGDSFAHLILSGTMTDRRAAEAVMLKHRVAVSRDQVLTRLWDIANKEPESKPLWPAPLTSFVPSGDPRLFPSPPPTNNRVGVLCEGWDKQNLRVRASGAVASHPPQKTAKDAKASNFTKGCRSLGHWEVNPRLKSGPWATHS